jgi:pimeloyl-[acyl-carrier protein] methyl ester esterase
MNANASRVHVEVVGEGPPLVLLHGFAMHGGLFAPIVGPLAARHRVYIVDLPGHGYSAPLAPYTVDAVIGAIGEALASIDAPIDVLGWSLGGALALAWAAAAPSRFARLVLVSTTPAFVARPDWPHGMDAQTLARFGDELHVAYEMTLKRFLTLQVHGSDEGRATLGILRGRLFERGQPSQASLTAALGLLIALDLRSIVPTVQTPALVISGDRDTLAPSEAGAWLAQTLPHAQFVLINGAAHAPFLSHREQFLAATRGFLDAR